MLPMTTSILHDRLPVDKNSSCKGYHTSAWPVSTSLHEVLCYITGTSARDIMNLCHKDKDGYNASQKIKLCLDILI